MVLTAYGLILSAALLSGLILFRKKTIAHPRNFTDFADVTHTAEHHPTVSVIIPARNEERNLPHLLESLQKQTFKPDEVIVVDDHSHDRTRSIAERYGVKVLAAPELPPGWTGKAWAVWNGYLQSSGDLLVFLDADVRLADVAIESLISEQRRQGGVISVVPYHIAEKFYEKFAMVLNLLGTFAFTSPFEDRNERKGLYGACIVTTRADYDQCGGHRSIYAEMLDDLSLGARFQAAGIRVTNYLGCSLVSFRMYPSGFRSELEGFAKGAILSTSALHPFTLFFIIIWIVGLIVSQFALLWVSHVDFPILLWIGYAAFVAEIGYFNRSVGTFGIIHPILPIMSLLFFLVVVSYSLYQSIVRKKVIWKGRYVDVGRGER